MAKLHVAMEAITLQNVTKKYTQHTALNKVNMHIPKQCIHGLLGPNGAGKTTVIRIINQIIHADKGEVLIYGEKLSPKHIPLIGYLPEERGLYRKLTVKTQLFYLARLRGMRKDEALKQISYWMEKFDMQDWCDKKIQDISKGMAQKVQFINAVMHTPPILVLDEPFSGFDPINAELIREEIIALKEKGATIILSTHRMETVEVLCDRMSLMHKAQNILEGEKMSIKQQFQGNTHTYKIAYKGLLPQRGTHYEVTDYEVTESENAEQNLSASTIKTTDQAMGNDILQELIQHVTLERFEQKTPSMNEIFLQVTKEGSSE